MKFIATTVGMFFIAAISTFSVAFASKPEPLGLARYSASFQRLVEQQTPGGATQPDPSLWVVNPLIPQCAWDSDDEIKISSSVGRVLDPGAVALTTECLVADHAGHLIWFSVLSPRPTLRVTLSFPDYNRTIELQPEKLSQNEYAWKGCVIGPEFDYDAIRYEALPEIASSNGGRGKISRVIFSIENVGPRSVRDIGVLGALNLDTNQFRDARCRFPLVKERDPADPWYLGAGWLIGV